MLKISGWPVSRVSLSKSTQNRLSRLLVGRGTSLNNQITFLNPLTEGNEVNEETPIEHEMLCQAVSEMMQGLVDGDEGGQKADDGGRMNGCARDGSPYGDG